MSLHKKLQQAYIDGINDGQEFILRAIRETKGIGPILEKRIIENARQLAERKVNHAGDTEEMARRTRNTDR